MIQLFQSTEAGLFLPFIGTTVGAACVFVLRKNFSERSEKALNGLAGGVMLAASIWSLLIPAAENYGGNDIACIFRVLFGFIFGIFMLIIFEGCANKMQKTGKMNIFGKSTVMIFALIFHNIPEGMAVGAVYAGVCASNGNGIIEAFALSLGIAIQNLPEGAVVSMPIHASGKSKKSAFLYGVLSGTVEPVAALFTILFSDILTFLLPYLLAFAAGAMFYVVIMQTIPEIINREDKYDIYGFCYFVIGFAVMMTLDIVFG